MKRVLGFLAGLVAFGVLADSGHMSLKTSDPREAIYTWSSAVCGLTDSTVTVLAKSAAGKAHLHFVFRGFADTIRMLGENHPLPLEITNTRTMGMTFQDREGTLWAFQPHRNHAGCRLTLKKQAGELKVWGSCDKLTPRAEKESFSVSVSIAEESAIRCKL